MLTALQGTYDRHKTGLLENSMHCSGVHPKLFLNMNKIDTSCVTKRKRKRKYRVASVLFPLLSAGCYLQDNSG